MPDYSVIESRIEQVIRQKYRLTESEHIWNAVKTIDREILMAEKRAMFGEKPGEKWTGEEEVNRVDIKLHYYTPEQAESEFLRVAQMYVPSLALSEFPEATK